MSKSICNALSSRNTSGYNTSDETAVQKIVAQALIWKIIFYSLGPAILLFFLGSWSDRNQCRKLLILLPVIGQALSNIGLLTCTYFFYEISMEFTVVIDILPTALLGGNNMLFTGIFSYISDNTTHDRKTWRIGVAQIILNVCTTIGTAISGIIYRLIGFYGVFSTATTLYLCAALYGFYFIKEENSIQKKRCKIIKDVFNLKKTLKTYSFLTKKENRKKRKQLFLIIIVGVLIAGPTIGENAVLYLYTRFKFNWDEINFSIFYTYHTVAHLVGSYFALTFFTKCFKVSDNMLGVTSLVSKILGCIVYTLAPTALIFYAGTIVEIFSNVALITSRSILSKIVSQNELGKANSMLGLADSLVVMVYGPMYSALYKATINVFPGSFYLLGATSLIPAIIIFLWLYFHQKKEKVKESVEAVDLNSESLLNSNQVENINQVTETNT